MPELKKIILVYAIILACNFVFCALLWVHTRTKHYALQCLTYLSLALTGVLHSFAAGQPYIYSALAASTHFLATLMIAELITLINQIEFRRKNFLKGYFIGLTFTLILNFFEVHPSLMAFPVMLGATFPVLYVCINVLFINKKDLTFINKAFVWIALINTIHNLDYAYAIDKPELMPLGFGLAVITVFILTTFSTAAVLESLTKEITRIKMQSEYKAILMNSAKLSSLGVMASGLAHEINNPLGVIQLTTDVLKRSLQKGSFDQNRMVKITESISNAVARITKIIIALRSFSRDASHDPLTVVPIKDLIEETLIYCEKRFFEKGVSIYKMIPPSIEARCRPIQLSQALLALLNNSFDAVLLNKDKKWIKIEVTEEDDRMNIRISDNGSGISPDTQEKIFEPFYTTKDVGSGAGLGLSIALGMIESQNGTLFLDKNSAETSFIISLPSTKSKN